MSVTVPVERPKASTTNTVNQGITIGAVVEHTNGDGTISQFLPVIATGVTPTSAVPFNVAGCTVLSGNSTVAISSSTTGIVDGAAVSGPFVPSGATVSNVNSSAMALSAAPTGNYSGPLTITAAPTTGNVTLAGIELIYTPSGPSEIPITLKLHNFDGSLSTNIPGNSTNSPVSGRQTPLTGAIKYNAIMLTAGVPLS